MHIRFKISDRGMAGLAGLALALLLCGCAPGYHPGAKANGLRVPSRVGAFQSTQMKAAVIPPPGIIFSKSTAPLGARVPGRPIGSRVGTAVSHSIGLPPLPFRGLIGGSNLITWGNSTVKAAQANGKITEPSHSDYESMVVLMIYRRMKVTTYGE
jgi:hypothetical protein